MKSFKRAALKNNLEIDKLHPPYPCSMVAATAQPLAQGCKTVQFQVNGIFRYFQDRRDF